MSDAWAGAPHADPLACARCGAVLIFDAEALRAARHEFETLAQAPVLYRCLNGHTMRLWHAETEARSGSERRLCIVCGVELPRGRRAWRLTCSPDHRRFVQVKREEYKLQRRALKGQSYTGLRFVLEEQPWYRGAAVAFRPPAVPTFPLFPEIPRAWLDGFRAVYPALEVW